MDELLLNLKKYSRIEKSINSYINIKEKKDIIEISIIALKNKRYAEIILKNEKEEKEKIKFVFNESFDDDILLRIVKLYQDNFKVEKQMILPSEDKGYYVNISSNGDCLKISNFDMHIIKTIEKIFKPVMKEKTIKNEKEKIIVNKSNDKKEKNKKLKIELNTFLLMISLSSIIGILFLIIVNFFLNL